MINRTVSGGGSTFGNHMVPSKFFELPAIKRIEVRGVSSMCQSVSSSSTVEELYLDTDDNLNKFPYVLKDLKKLRILSLSGNQIEGPLTSDIKKFTALEELYIDNNKLNGEIIIPDNLKVLSVKGNTFTTYSKTNNNKVLEKISVRNNMINDTFVSDLIKVKSLKDIDLSLTKITKLPNAIFNLTNVEKLDLHGNPNLKTRIINFGFEKSTPLDYCNFDSNNILCYQNSTCAEEETYLKNIKACTEKEINETRFDYTSSSFKTLKYSKINYIGVPLIMLIIYTLF
ncbi:L domain-like protein [Anaeromyces robustus]|uniref:L domain-like protein n=1 Tax=Anaeromyces robustus TaxID=1754192 RepID=A0A1Y1WCF5_9FUNG|nr:L domain-like protein [Anaeromyces robustus]|eukprot:ORX71008.1 L domain-like protein [Anaeromyces robustus]